MQDLMRFTRPPTRMCRKPARCPGRNPRWHEKSRGVTLTIFAVLFALLAISNFLKPFHLDPSVGFVFMGTKLTGAGNAVMGPLFGIILLAYAYGIWAMRQFALPVAYIFCPVGDR